MKKLLTLTFVLTALLLGAIAINAQPGKKKGKKAVKVAKHNGGGAYGNAGYYPIGYNKGHYNFRGVYIYYTQKNVWKRGKLFKNTYQVKVFRNGYKTTKLVKSVPIGKRVFYRTVIEKKGRKTFRVTYKITRFPNGKVKKKVVKKVLIKKHHKRKW